MAQEGDASKKLNQLSGLSSAGAEKIRSLVKQEVNSFARDVWAEVTRNLSNKVLKRQTGRLATSIRSNVEQTSDGYIVRVGSDVPYAAIHEFGGRTKPHDIRPKKGTSLFFKVGGSDVFAKVVHHPGSVIPERPYFRPAIAVTVDKYRNRFDDIFKKIADSLGRA